MNDRAKDTLAFAVFMALSVALTVAGMVWLGFDARAHVDVTGNVTGDGVVAKSASVLVLWFGPAFMALFGALSAPVAAWLSAVLGHARAQEGQEDVARGLTRYLAAGRLYVAGFMVLTIGLQIFALVRAAGVARPLGLDADGVGRVFFVFAGLLFVFIGNVAPRIPYVANRWIDAARHFRGNRFAGWVFVLGGIAYVVAALTAPSERLVLVTGALSAAMIGLPLIRYVMLTLDQRREAASGDCGPGR